MLIHSVLFDRSFGKAASAFPVCGKKALFSGFRKASSLFFRCFEKKKIPDKPFKNTAVALQRTPERESSDPLVGKINEELSPAQREERFKAYVEAGEIEAAGKMVGEIADPKRKSESLWPIVKYFWDRSKIDEAIDACAKMPDPECQSKALTCLSENCLGGRRPKEAVAARAKISDPKIKTSAVSRAVDFLIRQGKIHLAFYSTCEIPDLEKQAEKRADIVAACIVEERDEDADRITETITDPAALSRVVVEHAYNGNPLKGSQIAQRIPDPKVQSKALTAITDQTCTRFNRSSQARLFAERMKDPEMKRKAIQGIKEYRRSWNRIHAS